MRKKSIRKRKSVKKRKNNDGFFSFLFGGKAQNGMSYNVGFNTPQFMNQLPMNQMMMFGQDNRLILINQIQNQTNLVKNELKLNDTQIIDKMFFSIDNLLDYRIRTLKDLLNTLYNTVNIKDFNSFQSSLFTLNVQIPEIIRLFWNKKFVFNDGKSKKKSKRKSKKKSKVRKSKKLKKLKLI